MSGRGYNGLTLWLDEDSDELILLDQTRLPNEESTVAISTARALYDAIRRLQVRGAPAIGVAAALGLYACAVRFEDETPGRFFALLAQNEGVHRLRAAYGAEPVLGAGADGTGGGHGDDTRDAGTHPGQALAIFEEDIAICRAIGENGLSLLKDGDTLLTHCNAGALAAVQYGTALAPVYVGLERGMRFRIYADETRPLLQGARLTCYELHKAGADVTLLCDGMAARLMQSGEIDAVIVGCDRVARNYDFANKTGTLSLAVNAKYFGVPFYVAAPSPTFDDCCATGADIVIEQRPGRRGDRAVFFFAEGAGGNRRLQSGLRRHPAHAGERVHHRKRSDSTWIKAKEAKISSKAKSCAPASCCTVRSSSTRRRAT